MNKKFIMTENRIKDVVKTFMQINFPEFNKMDCHIAKRSFNSMKYFIGNESDTIYATYHLMIDELQMNREVWTLFVSTFGEKFLGYLLDWFNKEFDENYQLMFD